MSQDPVTLLLVVSMIICSAWAYPRLNGWLYRRRQRREHALAVVPDATRSRRPPIRRRRRLPTSYPRQPVVPRPPDERREAE